MQNKHKFFTSVKNVLNKNRTMKLSFLLFALVLFNVQANSYSQNKKISLEITNGTVKSVLEKIEAESKFNFFYKTGEIDVKRRVSINVTDRSIKHILDILFKGENVNYSLVKKQIVLKRKSTFTSVLSPDRTEILNEPPVQYSVSGKVTDAQGTPLPGASIVEKGTTNGTQSDFDGVFSIELSDENSILLISYIGYAAKEVSVAGKSVIEVVLNESAAGLDEVVIIGYGTQRKSDLTGAVANIEAEDLNNQPSPRVDQLLQGRLAGVNVTSASGAPGDRASIRIRGGNSVQGDNEPLYVIDGFVAGTDFDLNSINVNDIASIDVLKDASSISIYGTRGANGVILITTKDGKNNSISTKPSISLNAYSGVQTILRKINYLNGQERAAWGTENVIFTGDSDPFQNPPAPIANTNWQDVITQVATVHNLDFSVSGNTEKTNYYFSSNYLNQEGIVKGTGLERYNIRSNFDYELASYLKFGSRINLSIQNRDNNLINMSSLELALPVFPRFDDQGSFWSENYVAGTPFDNPEARIALNTNENKTTNLLGNFYLEFKPFEGFSIRSTIGPSIVWNKSNIFESGRIPTRAAIGTGGFGRVGTSYKIELLQENTISYNKEIDENNRFDLLAGFTWQTSNTEFLSSSAAGIPNDNASFDILQIGDRESFDINTGFDAFQLTSWIGRANYSYKNKYLLTLAGRVDGSSRFSNSANPYAFFPSGAFAWRAIEENFIRDLNLFSNLKLRASYGRSGSQGIDSFVTLEAYEPVPSVFNNSVVAGVRRNRPSNPDLRWETTDQLDIGLEMGFFKNRLNLEFDYYKKTTNDLLLPRQIASQSGFNDRLENVGSIENKGVELLINSYNISKDDFQWSTTLTIAANRSKVLDLGGVDEIVILNNNQGDVSKLIVGEPVGVFTGLDYLGTWADQATIDNEGYSGFPAPLVGGPRFLDTNGDGVLSRTDDSKIIGNPEPSLFGGLLNTFKYKNLTLDIFFQGTFGNDLYNTTAPEAFFGRDRENLFSEVGDRWTPENPSSRIPRAGTIDGLNVPSNTELIEDGTHVRLKNIRLAYTFEKKVLGLNSFTLFASAQNVFLISNFRGFDPEATQFGPDNSEQFSNVLRGFLDLRYPTARTVTLGLNINF